PCRCQPTTVSGPTICSEFRQLFQSLDSTTQNIRSIAVSCGRGWRAFHTASCCRSARFSSVNSRCVRTVDRSVPRRIPSHLTMTGRIADQSAKCKTIATPEILEGTRTVVNDGGKRPDRPHQPDLGCAVRFCDATH